MKSIIYNGIPWFDQNGDVVNAHGACIIKEGDRYYLFGEYKTNDDNKYIGFSCYSTQNFYEWKYEGPALPAYADGLLGPNRIGERVKVIKSPKTGKFIMLMHTDNQKYCDPCIGLAVSDRINDEYAFIGPLLYNGQPIRKWDMGTFVDDDGTAYLLTHEGNIYKLNDDYTEAVELMTKDMAPGGESPAMYKNDGIYYAMFSNKTSWERNDNYYLTARSLSGPWEYKGLFCPEGSLTFNTQCSFVFDYMGEKGNVPIYLGDRWSYPKQAASATLVLLPLSFCDGKMNINEYYPIWSPDDGKKQLVTPNEIWSLQSNIEGDSDSISFYGNRVILFGAASKHGGYGKVEIVSDTGKIMNVSVIDFYSRIPDRGIRYVSPLFAEGRYTVKITVLGESGVWFSKDGTRYGSDDCCINIYGYSVNDSVPKIS